MNPQTTLLVVDDDPAISEVFASLLRCDGYEVRLAATGGEGLEMVRWLRPALVLLDVKLPDVQGTEVCRQIKADPSLQDVFVVLISGQAISAAEKVDGLAGGADEYLTKPIGGDELSARIRACLRLRDATAALRRSEATLRVFLDALPEPAALVDRDGSLLVANVTMAHHLGRSRAELVGNLFDLIPGDIGSSRRAQFDELVRSGQPRHFEDSRADRHYFNRFTPILDEAGAVSHVALLAFDITERKRLEREVLEISANERRRIGHDLHDGLAQYLAGIALRSKTLEQMLAAEASPRAGEVKKLTSLIGNAIRQTRSLARGFDPVGVGVGGQLVDALQHLAAESGELFRRDCKFHGTDPTVHVDPPVAIALYRIAQEAIRNAVKHGEARHIRVELAVDTSSLSLRVQDDGVGFQPGQEEQSGMGLRVMTYRARSIGASLEVRAEPGRGTEVRCLLPRAAWMQRDSQKVKPQ
jgi:two-component system sensor kinase FixL